MSYDIPDGGVGDNKGSWSPDHTNEQLELVADLLRDLSRKLDEVLTMLGSIDHGVHN